MNENGRPRFSLTMWIVLGVIMVIAYAMTYPLFVRQSKCREGQTQTVSNARQIGLALFEFQTEYGRFPDETTAAKIRRKTGSRFNLGSDSSNDNFRQLIAAEIVSNETLFYAKTGYTKKQGNRAERDDEALAPGEVGFGYLTDGKSAFSTEGNPARTLACSPMAFGGKNVNGQTFDPSIHDGKALILRMDNSVQSLPIHSVTHRAMVGGGKHLLQTGEDTVWGDSAKPVIVPPLPKP